MGTRFAGTLLALVLAALVPVPGPAQPVSAPVPAQAELSLFAIEITVGPRWDASKAPQDQAYFREHSANLRRLREGGHIVLGARYADKGLVVVAAASAEGARKMMDADPSIAAGTFVFEVHPFSVFYPGTVQAPPRK